MSPPTNSHPRAHSARHVSRSTNPIEPAVGSILAQGVSAVSDRHRGPSGAPPPPPKDLATARLPLTVLTAGTVFTRVHSLAFGPIHFSPGTGRPAQGRFESATGVVGVLYAALNFDGAVVEILLRKPGRRLISVGDITSRSVAALVTNRDVALVDLRGPGLQRLGLDGTICTGPYKNCSLWADELFAHPDRPDGIIYPSRHDPGEACIALLERNDLVVTVARDAVPLRSIMPQVIETLRRYGKGLE
jgi:hypothetical protein